MKLVTLGAAVATALALVGSLGPASPASSKSASPAGSVILVDKPFRCEQYPQPLDLELVKVTLGRTFGGTVDDAANLSRGPCTGRIGRLEIDTWIGDGVKVGSATHDLRVESGYVYCHDHLPGNHQDGIQALGGTRVAFRNLHVFCPTSNNASFFLSAGGNGLLAPVEGDWPTDVTCENCQFDGGPNTVFLGKSIRSGVTDTLVHAGKYHAVRVADGAVDPLVANVIELPCGTSC